MTSPTVKYPPPDHPFHKHVENLRVLLKGLTQAERVHKEMIRQGNTEAVEYSSRMHGLVIGMVAEARLRKVVSDPDGFNERERILIGRARTQVDRWTTAIDLAFRRQYNVPIHLEVATSSCDPSAIVRYITMNSLLENDLRPIIEDRNKAAHGQWAWYLNSKETDFTGTAPTVLNYRALQRRSEVIQYLAEIVHALVVSEPTFQRDFNVIYARLQLAKSRIDGADYPQLEKELRAQAAARRKAIQATAAS